MKNKENQWKYEAVISVLVILLIIGGVKFKSYYDKKVEEAAIEEEKQLAKEKADNKYDYILKKVDVYAGKDEGDVEEDYWIRRDLYFLSDDIGSVDLINPETGELNIGFMHTTKVDDFYIYDDYLKMLLRAYYLYFDEELAYSYDEIIALYKNCTEEDLDQFEVFLRFHYDYCSSYLEKVSKAYDKYLEVNGEKYAGKEKYQLNYEDCLALEEYFEEEPEPEETTEVDDEEYMYDLIFNSMADDSNEKGK